MKIFFNTDIDLIQERLKNVDTFLLDFDGTLVDYHDNEYAALMRLFDDIGLDADLRDDAVQYYQVENKKLWEKFEKNLVSIDEVRIRRFELVKEKFSIEGETATVLNQKYLNYFVDSVSIDDDTLEGLKLLRKTFPQNKMVIVTNGIHDVQTKRIANIGIEGLYDEMISSESAGSAKPDELIFRKAAEIADSSYDKCLMIGDSLTSDIDGARQIGILNFLIDKDMTNNYAIKPDIVVNSFFEFSKYIITSLNDK